MIDYLKKNAKKLAGAMIFSVLIGWLYISMRDFAGAELVDKYRMLCDAISLPGMLLVLFGGLMWVAGKGTLDALGFIGCKIVFSLIPGKRLEREERYGDYVQRQREKPRGDYSFLFVAGGFCIAVSLIFLVLFYSAK